MRSFLSGSKHLCLGRFALALLVFAVTHAGIAAMDQGLSGIPIKPSETDPAITAFNTPHYIYVDRDIVVSHDPEAAKDRRELLLFLPGTNGHGQGAIKFCQLAARAGYHVIFLMYPDDVAAAEVCRDDRDPNSFEDFRMALIAGAKSKKIKVTRTDCIENRLTKLLAYLARTRPQEQWDQFLQPSGEIKWESIAVSGQSQGGGHAAIIAVKHQVARVVGTGAPKDYSLALAKPAAWYGEPSATPKDRFFFFNHQQDHQGCSPRECLENMSALGLDALGAPVNVDSEPYPFRHSHILTTNYPGTKLDSKTAHTTVIADRNAARFEKVWLYMLTEPAP